MVRHLVLMWLCLAATIAYIHRNSIAVAEKTIREELGLSKFEMGLVMSAFFLTYAFFQIPSGWLGHVLGSRRALPVFSILWSGFLAAAALAGILPGSLTALVGTWPGATAVSFVILAVTRLGMGAAQAGIFPCSALVMADWMPRTRRAVASGALGSFMSVGGALGSILTGICLEYASWRWLFVIFALPGLVWAVWFYLWFRDRPSDHPAVTPEELRRITGPDSSVVDREESIVSAEKLGRVPPTPSDQRPTPWLALLCSPAMWCICGQQFFRAAGYIFFASWFATYLSESRNVSTREAGILNSLPLWGVVLGSLIGGWASDWVLTRTGSRRLGRQGVSVVSMLLCAACIAAAYPIHDVLPAVLLITAGSFLASFAGPCAYAITIDMGGKHVAPVFSTMNMCGNIGAMVFPLVVPWLEAATGSWDAVLFVFMGVYVGAALCWLLLNPNGTIVRGDVPSSPN